MGLFSSLFNSAKREIAKDVFNEVIKDQVNSANQNNYSAPAQAPAQAPQPQQNQQYNQPSAEPSPSGFSWGENMPNEENQFNFNGPFYQYFETVFREGFPQYNITSEKQKGRSAYVYTFTSGGRTALVVEVISERSSPYAIRQRCKNNNIPYLRYYYDHDGWWNTKAYVLQRTGKALGM